MIKNKRGLSAIVTTMLIVILVLVAVGIVWGVVSGVLTGGAENIEIGAKCLNVDVRASVVNCADPADCTVTFVRTGTETEEIAGVKLVFRDSATPGNSGVIDESGNIEHLVGKTVTGIDSTVLLPDSIEVTVYFVDESGIEKLCSQAKTFNF